MWGYRILEIEKFDISCPKNYNDTRPLYLMMLSRTTYYNEATGVFHTWNTFLTSLLTSTVGQSKQIQQEQHEAEIKAIRNHVSHPEAHFASVQTKTMVNRVTHAKTSLQSDDWTLCLCCHLHLSSTVNQRSDHLFTYSTCRPKVYGCLLLDVSIFCHYSNSKVRISNFMMQYIPDCDSITLEDNLDEFFCFFTLLKIF